MKKLRRWSAPIFVETLEQRFAPSVNVLNSALSPEALSISPAWFGSPTTSETATADLSTQQATEATQHATEQINWKGQTISVVADEWIVQIKSNRLHRISSVSDSVSLFSSPKIHAQVLYGLGMAGQVLIYTPGASVDAITKWLGHKHAIAYFEPNRVVTTDTTPNDPDYSKQWALDNIGQTGGTSGADISAPEAWDITTGSSNVVVAVLDTGIDYTHPDLAANMWTNPGGLAGDPGGPNDAGTHGYNFISDTTDPMDDVGHGTHVAGIIGAVGNNGIGMTGINWNVRLMAVKVFSPGGGYEDTIIAGMNYIATLKEDGVNIDVVSASFGNTGPMDPDLVEEAAINRLGNDNVLLVAAAGNNGYNNGTGDVGTDDDNAPIYPACYDLPNIISVAATDDNNQLATFSNYGATSVDLAAPGVDILSTYPKALGDGSGYQPDSGTSMATPYVSGVAALAWSIDPSATYAQIRNAIFAGVDTKTSLSGKMVTGGELNALGTLEKLSSISIDNVTLAEGNSGTTPFVFTVSLSSSNSQTVTVDFATADGTATTADNDYTATSGTLTFSPGVTTQTVSVTVNGDTAIEPNETFTVNLSNPTNTIISAGTGTGTILNDDGPILSITPTISALEGNTGTTDFVFTASLSEVSAQTIMVDYATADGTATASGTAPPADDYQTTNGTLTFASGQTSQTITVLVNGDTVFEPDETFFVNLSNATGASIFAGTGTGIIQNDDHPPTVSIASPLPQNEGNQGTTSFNFIVSLSVVSGAWTTVDYTTADGSATIADNDYRATSGTVIFAPGQTSQTITVSVNGDMKVEPNETFTVNLSSAVNATILAGTATGTILNDDLLPAISIISPPATNEGNSGTTPFDFTVSLSNVSYQTITVNYATADGTATVADNDYQATSGTLTFAPNQTSQTIIVLVNGDTKIEPDESFSVNLSNPVNAILSDLGFKAATNFTVGAYPYSVAVGDFNGDGIPDLAVANKYDFPGTVSILLGDGHGGFGAATNFAVGAYPVSVAVGDFNADGKQDLAVTNSAESPGTVSILLGDGTGSFGAATNFVVGYDPVSVAVGDFNGDGIPDLAVANEHEFPGTVSILLGHGDGTFWAAANFAVGHYPDSVAVGDFNGDGKQDLAVANYLDLDPSVSILLGDGHGSFGAARNYSVGSDYYYAPSSVVVGDFNGDGKQDLAVANQGYIEQWFAGKTVSILLGLGDGSFGTATKFDVGTAPRSIAVGDFNGDGNQDLAVANYWGDNVSILLGLGTGSFSTATNFDVGYYPTSVAVGDFNADGKQDLAVTNSAEFPGTVSILLNSCGSGTILNDDSPPMISINDVSQAEGDIGTTPYVFTVNLSKASNQTITVSYASADGTATVADNDYQATSGTLTFAPNQTSQTIIVLVNGDTKIEPDESFSVNLSNPVNAILSDLGFKAATNFTVGAYPYSVAVGDFNGDGIPDLAVANYLSNTVSILLGTGTGSFGTATNFTVDANPRSLALGDFNGDGKLDLVTANYGSDNISILLGNGNGGFGAATNLATGTTPLSIAIGDFNGDGKLDLAVTNLAGTISILLGDGHGGFGTAANFTVGAYPDSVAVGDFNGDGKLDLAVANGSSDTVSILLGNGHGGFGTAANFAVRSTAASVTTGDFNGDGKLDLAVANEGGYVSILLGDGHGGFGAATNFLVGSGSSPYSVAVGDFNGDGVQDLATANAGSNNISILLGDGTGKFGAATNFAVGSFPCSVVVGDFDGDGKQDLAVANESSNTVSILLNASPASHAKGTGTILNDDSQPQISINDVSQNEGNSGTTPFVFTVSLSAVSGLTTTVNYATADGTATTADSDYQATSGQLTFAPGVTSQTVTVLVNGDYIAELDETFSVHLTSPVNATLATSTGQGTIVNDDITVASPYFDKDGDTISVRLSGHGTYSLATDLAGDLRVILTGTNSKSSLTISVKKSKTGDGLTNVALIQSDGDLKSVSAKTSNLVGSGIHIAGYLGSLTIHDVGNGANITAGGTPVQSSTIQTHVIGDNTAIDLGSAIKSISAARVGQGDITAPSIGSIKVSGDSKASIHADFNANVELSGTDVLAGKLTLGSLSVANVISGASIDITGGIGNITAGAIRNSIIEASSITSIKASGNSKAHLLGDFNATVELSGTGVLAGKLALGSLSVANAISGALIDITGGLGGIGNVTAMSILSSVIEAGYNPTDANNLMGGGDFLQGLGIKSVTVKGYAFVNSVLAADKVGTVLLADVQQNNGGLDFGVIAGESIGSVLDQLTGWKAASSIPFDQNETDFHVKII